MSPFDERDRQSIVLDLQNEDEDVRRLAIERVSSLDSTDAIPSLVSLLGDESWRVRKAVVERLTAWPDPEPIALALIAALGDGENPGRRNAAVDALIRTGRSAVPQLVDAVSGDDADVRKFVVDVLAGIGDDSAVPALIGRLQDGDINVRASAADALGAIGGQRASEAVLATAVDDAQDSLVRFSALRAIAALELALPAHALGSALSDPVLRPPALDVVGRVASDAEADDVLEKALLASGRGPREAAMRSILSRIARLDGAAAVALTARARAAAAESPKLLPDAIERLAEADLPACLFLAQFLGLAGDSRAAIPLLRAAADEALEEVALGALVAIGEAAESEIDQAWPELDLLARRCACRFFGRASSRESVTRLLSALDDDDPAVRSEAATALADREAVEAAGPLVVRLGRTSLDSDVEAEDECQVLTAALVRLARAGDAADLSRTMDLLLAALSGAGDPVRVAIARVVGQLGRSEDGEVVELLLKDPFADVRRAAVEALVSVGTAEVSESLHLAIADESAEVRIAAARALEACTASEVVVDLRRLAEDEDPRVRATATLALGTRFGNDAEGADADAAREVLRRALADEAPVALAALEAIREQRLPLPDVDALLRREEPEVVRETVRCVGSHGDFETLASVIPLCSHAVWSVRAEAIQVLADRRVTRAVPEILRRLDLERDDFVRRVTLQALERLEG
jgi:HEAT repeat protein